MWIYKARSIFSPIWHKKIPRNYVHFLAENKAGLVKWHFSVEERKSMTPVSGCVLSESDHKEDLE